MPNVRGVRLLGRDMSTDSYSTYPINSRDKYLPSTHLQIQSEAEDWKEITMYERVRMPIEQINAVNVEFHPWYIVSSI